MGYTGTDDLLARGEAAIDDLIADQAAETLQFECKSKSDPSTPKCNNDDKRNLGKALSGFANSMGGTIVFGIDARPIDGIDCIIGRKPISNVEAFAEELRSLAAQLVMPRLDGVEIQTFAIDDQRRGYVAVTIPRSERRPHRSEAAGDKTYYRRSGTNFHAMEHFEIEDAFKRTSTASLFLITSVKSGISVSGTNILKFKVAVSLGNDSLHTAKFPYLFIQDIVGGELDPFGIDGNRNHGLKRLPGKPAGRFVGGANDVVHPQIGLVVTQVSVDLHEAQFEAESDDTIICSFKCRFGSENAPLQSEDCVLTAKDLRQFFK